MPLLLPDSLAPESFLAEYWQKRPLYLPKAIDQDLPTIDADEIGWLATLPDVESRLIFTTIVGDRASYRVMHGPFAESELKALPRENWTLLVNDVDKHLPDFRAYFALLPFIPQWRIDDLMVSVAAPGGSVGPHKDNYDVFLCQGDGVREWRLSDESALANDKESTSLDLLEPFPASTKHTCVPGDVLYLPPTVPHWGIAQDLCTTYSIGMRAPTDVELASCADQFSGQETQRPKSDSASTETGFYSDRDLQPDEAADGSISCAAIRRVQSQGLLGDSITEFDIANILGATVTEPKAWLSPESPCASDRQRALFGHNDLEVHGMARLAWYYSDQVRLIFANGVAHDFQAAASKLVRQACLDRLVQRTTIQTLMEQPDGSTLLCWLLERGVFRLDSMPE